MELKKYKLKELLSIKNGKDHQSLNDGGYPVYGSGGIMRYADSYLYDGPSVLLPRKGSLTNIQFAEGKFWTVDTCYYTEVNTNLTAPYYLYYYLKQLDLSNLNSGTGVPSMTFDSYYSISVVLPDLPIQQKIAQILSTIDRKISLNRSINKELETMAKQLYDYWFVQFDFPDANGKPYKSSGGEMVFNSILNSYLPKNWIAKRLDSFVDIFTGKKDVSKIKPGPYKFFSCAPNPIPCDSYINDGPIIMVSGNGSYTGRVMFYDGKCDLYQRTYGCKMKNENKKLNPFIYYTLKYKFNPLYSGGKHGSAIPYIVLEDLAGFTFPFDESIAELFSNTIFNSFTKSNKIGNEEIEELTKLRDELLPLLMNGQVSIK